MIAAMPAEKMFADSLGSELLHEGLGVGASIFSPLVWKYRDRFGDIA
jgi:hypothetical protein